MSTVCRPPTSTQPTTRRLSAGRGEDPGRARYGSRSSESVKDGTPHHAEDEKEFLTHIISTLNETYGLNLTEDDKVDFERIKNKVEANEELKAVMIEENTLENIRYKFDKVVDSSLLDFVHTKIDLYKKLSDPRANAMLKQMLFEGYQLQHDYNVENVVG